MINEADTLSRDAQAALRRTMEKYMSNMRIILCANSTSRLIAPIRSRCLLMRVAAPSHEEVRPLRLVFDVGTDGDDRHAWQMRTVLNHVATRAGIPKIPQEAADEIVRDSNGNMRKAILVLEALKMQT